MDMAAVTLSGVSRAMVTSSSSRESFQMEWSSPRRVMFPMLGRSIHLRRNPSCASCGLPRLATWWWRIMASSTASIGHSQSGIQYHHTHRHRGWHNQLTVLLDQAADLPHRLPLLRPVLPVDVRVVHARLPQQRRVEGVPGAVRAPRRVPVQALDLGQAHLGVAQLGLVVQQALGREAREAVEDGQVGRHGHEPGHAVVAALLRVRAVI